MNANLTALVVAIFGVLGTLASALITQVLSMRARTRDLSAQVASSEREARFRAGTEARQTQRAEFKTAIASYLEAAQHLQTQIYAREHGRDFEDVAMMVEQVWLAHAQVDILCSTEMRIPLLDHANALNEVARHAERHGNWWEYLRPYKAALLDAVRKELNLPALTAQQDATLDSPISGTSSDETSDYQQYDVLTQQ